MSDDGKPVEMTHTVSVSVTIGVKGVYTALMSIASFGLLLLWFEADVLAKTLYWGQSGPTGDVHPFTNLWIAIAMLAAADVSEVFIPASAKKLVRTFGTFLYFFSINKAICTLHLYTIMGDSTDRTVGNFPQELNQRNTGRLGAALVIVPALVVFVMAYFRKRPSAGALLLGGLPALRAFVRVLSMILFLIAQVLAWSIKMSCAGPAWRAALPAMNQYTILLQLMLMIAGTFFSSAEAYDISLIFMAFNVFHFAPLFDDTKAIYADQDSFPGLWRAQISMVLIGTVLYTVCAFGDSRPSSRVNAATTIIDRVKSKPFIVSVVSFFIGFAAAVCIYVRSPKPDDDATYQTKTQAYFGSFAIIIPLLEMLSTILGNDVIHLFSLGYAINVLAYCGNLVGTGGATGYLRGGLLLEIVVVFAAILGRYIFAAPTLKPVNEYFEGEGRVDVLISAVIVYFSALGFEESRTDYLLWFAVALFILFGRLTASHDISRVAYFVIIVLLSGDTGYWPLIPGQVSKVLTCSLFVSGMMFLWRTANEHKGKAFECVDFDSISGGLDSSAAASGNHASSATSNDGASTSRSEPLLPQRGSQSPKYGSDEPVAATSGAAVYTPVGADDTADGAAVGEGRKSRSASVKKSRESKASAPTADEADMGYQTPRKDPADGDYSEA